MTSGPRTPGADGATPGPAGQGAEGKTRKVRAAGGVVWRLVPEGAEVVLVHRPRYDDWALPKGKAAAMESDEETARREVKEETGLSCRLGQELPATTYIDALGRAKTVRYWAMTVAPEGVAAPTGLAVPEGQSEVYELCWVPLDRARQRLTYPRDVIVLDALEGLLSSKVGRQEVDEVLEREPEGDETG